MARLQPISEQIQIAMKGSLDQVHATLVETAKRKHAEIMERDPRPGRFTRYVDGTLGAVEEKVKPTGVIEYNYFRLDVVVQFAMETLFDLSPVLTGEYRTSHTIFLNGVAVKDLKEWKPGDELVISNPVPYARKIESGSMKMRVSGTDRVYQQAEVVVKRRFGNTARIRFGYRSVVGMPYIPVGRGAGNAQRSAHAIERQTRAPSLIIEEYA